MLLVNGRLLFILLLIVNVYSQKMGAQPGRRER